MIEWSAGLNPRAVAGRLSVTKFTHKSCTGISASGIPRRTVKNMLQNGESVIQRRRTTDVGYQPDNLSDI